MYTLRTINEEGLQQNTALGNEYLYADRFMNGAAFRESFVRMFGVNHVADLDADATDSTRNCVGIVTTENGVAIPVWKFHDAYVMTDAGKTFSRLNRADR